MNIAAEGIESEAGIRLTSRGPLVASHVSMREALAVLDRVASANCTVLVTGESGTGKELAVAALHDASKRAKAPLITVNCGAIPENLVESELFGHARGAFTGAAGARAGLVAAAEGGTLFLDEVGELPLAAQVKLLRLLQAKEYTPVGETKAHKADIRVVAATNRDLRKEVEAGRFREDLYYRLDVIHVHLPPLRKRRQDIALLARHFLRRAAEHAGRPEVVGFSDEALALLVADDWPGNIRELENAVERAVLLSPSEVVPASCCILDRKTPGASIAPSRRLSIVPPSTNLGANSVAAPAAVPPVLEKPAPEAAPAAQAASEGTNEEEEDFDASEAITDLRAAVEAYENELIGKALRRAGNNKTKAAQFLGLHRTTLVEMLKRKRIEKVTRAA